MEIAPSSSLQLSNLSGLKRAENVKTRTINYVILFDKWKSLDEIDNFSSFYVPLGRSTFKPLSACDVKPPSTWNPPAVFLTRSTLDQGKILRLKPGSHTSSRRVRAYELGLIPPVL